MQHNDLHKLSKLSKIIVYFSIEPIDYSSPEEMKAIEVHFLGSLLLTFREAFYQARRRFSTDASGSIILLTDPATCVIRELSTLNAIMDTFLEIDIHGKAHRLTLSHYDWSKVVIKAEFQDFSVLVEKGGCLA